MPHWREDPANVRPMLALNEDPPVRQPGLIYEPKYDGIRALVSLEPPVRRGPPRVAIYSRNGNEKHNQFPAIVAALSEVARTLPVPVLLDGEIVAVDHNGRPLGFQFIQGRIHLTSPSDAERAELAQPAALVLFDLLRDGDKDVRGEPLAQRRLLLQERIRPSRSPKALVRLSEIVADDGRALLSRAKREGWEGLIAKDAMSVYHSGRRTPAWRKMKILHQQEFVIGGWTEPRQTRQHFGSLLIGYYEDGALLWAGSVGTGFDQPELDRVSALLRQREMPKSPFDEPVQTMTRPHWVRPDLVAEVRFTEWTSDGVLRQPVYLGMRSDKKARDVRREQRTSSRARSTRKPEAAAPSRAAAPRSKSRKGRGLSPEPDRAALDRTIDQLSALEASRKDGDIDLPGGGTLRVTNLGKVFWPDQKITKGELLRYYVEVAPLILPTLDDRPLVMKRFPNGVTKPAFYQQRHPDAPPAGIRREVLPEDVEPIDEEGPRDRIIGGSIATLLYTTQLGAISQDPWFSRVADPLHADFVAIDLDPGPGATFGRVLDVARWVKDELDRHKIPAWPKTSGSRGLHIYVPLPPRTTYETGQLLCQMIATIVSEKHPKAATVERMVKKRPHATVYVDYLQNILGKTLATAYSARASDYAGVSTPLTWAEVDDRVNPQDFTLRSAPERFRSVGDLWERLRTGDTVDIRALLRRSRAG